MNAIAEQILAETGSLPEGTILTAKGLLHLGSRAAVDQALSRLAREGKLLRVARGRYARPVTSRFGTRAPAPEKVAEQLAKLTGETIVPSGAAAANALGLTTQVPMRLVYLTSGRSRHVRIGRQTVEFKHAPAWQLQAPGAAAGRAMRALAWLGKGSLETSAPVLKRLPRTEQQKLLDARASMPGWMAEFVGKELGHGRASRTRSIRG